MADKRANFIIGIIDKLSSPLGKIGTSLALLRQSFLTVSGTVNKVINVVSDYVNAYLQSETATNKLTVALKNQGILTRKTLDDSLAFSSALQNQTGISDELITETQALLTTFGITGIILQETTKNALDLSAGLGIDLKTAALHLGKAFMGETSTLSKLGIKIAEGTAESEKFGAVMAVLQQRFGGSAAAALDTYAGRVSLLKEKWGDVKEMIGHALMPVLETLMNVLMRYIDALNLLFNQLNSVTSAMAMFKMAMLEGGKSLLEFFMNMYGAIPGMSKLWKLMGIDIEESIGTMKAAIDDEIAKVNQSATNAKEAADKYTEAELQKTNMMFEQHQLRNEFITAEEQRTADAAIKKQEEELAKTQADFIAELERLNQQEIAKNALFSQYTGQKAQILSKGLTVEQQMNFLALKKRLEDQKKFGEANLLEEKTLSFARVELEKKEQKIREDIQRQRVQNLSSTLNYVSSLSDSKTRALAIVGKAAAVAQATWDTYKAANMAWAAPPGPPWSAVYVAAVTAAGLANVARIQGVNMAAGGMVLPSSAGMPARLAEAGKPEVVIPLDDERTKEKLADVFGGVTININAGTLVADDRSIMELAGRIDEALFSLNRNRRSVALGVV